MIDSNKFRIEYYLNNDYMKQMIKLDEDNYEEDDSGTYSMCMGWYEKNSEMYTILLYEDVVVGYINFVSISKESYNKFKSGEIRDTDLSSNDIVPFSVNSANYCLFMSVVLRTDFRDGDAVKILSKAWQERVVNFQKKGYFINSILADCVSDDGERYVKRMGFNKVMDTSHNSKIYEKLFLMN